MLLERGQGRLATFVVSREFEIRLLVNALPAFAGRLSTELLLCLRGLFCENRRSSNVALPGNALTLLSDPP